MYAHFCAITILFFLPTLVAAEGIDDSRKPEYCGETVASIRCQGLTSGWTYTVYLTKGSRRNGCLTFDNGQGEALFLTDKGVEVSEQEFFELPTLTLGAHFDSLFYPYVELERAGSGYRGYFDAVNFTGGHEFEEIGEGEDLHCQPLEGDSESHLMI